MTTPQLGSAQRVCRDLLCPSHPPMKQKMKKKALAAAVVTLAIGTTTAIKT